MDFYQEPFTVFKTYCAIKAHFTSPYDFIKYKGKLPIKEKSFLNRKDRPFFNYLATVLTENDNVPFFVSQFVENSNAWIGDILIDKKESMKIYNSWSNRIDMLEDNYKIDLFNMGNLGFSWKTLLGYTDNNHPALFKLLLQRKINPETYIMIDKITNFIKKTVDVFESDSIYKEINFKYIKYGCFINIKKENILKITPKLLTNV